MLGEVGTLSFLVVVPDKGSQELDVFVLLSSQDPVALLVSSECTKILRDNGRSHRDVRELKMLVLFMGNYGRQGWRRWSIVEGESPQPKAQSVRVKVRGVRPRPRFCMLIVRGEVSRERKRFKARVKRVVSWLYVDEKVSLSDSKGWLGLLVQRKAP